ncbi:MAG: translocation/assembly module TamB domain-containing protein [Methylophilaceae bacterium]
MLRQLYLLFFITLLSLTSARGDLSISANTSLDTFSYDLEGISLKLEKLNARWQLSPFGDGKLLVESIQAKKLTITVHQSTKKSDKSGLPERIKLPFAASIQQGEVAELLIINGETQRTFSNVKFAIEADASTINIKQLSAGTPWGEATIALQMSTENPFALTGTAAIKQAASNTPFDIKTKLTGDLTNLQFESAMLLAKHDDKLNIYPESLNNTAPAARLFINGKIGLSDDFPINVQAKVTEIHPERLGNYPVATLNMDATIVGKFLPEALLDVQYATRDSQWQNQAFNSTGKLQLQGSKIKNLDLQAMLANNTFKANGSLGQTDSHIAWQADFADLSKFGSGYAGLVRADGTLNGTFENMALSFKLDAQKLHLAQGLNVEKLTGLASVSPEANGQVSGDFKATGLQYGAHPIMNAQITLQGSKTSHQLVAAAQGKDFKLNSSLQGGLTGSHWQGLLQNLIYEGSTPIKLLAPAPLAFDIASDNRGFSLGKTQLQFNQGRALIDQLNIGQQGFASTGRLEQFSLADLPPNTLPLPSGLKGNATFAAKWNLTSTDNLNGTINFWRESGDLTMVNADGVSKPLGLETVKTDINILNNQAKLSVSIHGRGMGDLEAEASTLLSKTEAGYGLLASAPLNLKANAQLHTLAWLPLSPSLMEANIDGAIKFEVAGNGTLKQPNLVGNLQANKLMFNLPREGVSLKDGELTANFDNDGLRIKQASWRGGDGLIKTNGLIHLKAGKPAVELAWIADKFTVISRADRLLILSGKGSTTLEDGILAITGDFTVDQGLAELAGEGTPVLGDDVVILGKTEIAPEAALKVLLNGLRISLGENFKLRGYGLDAELTGALTFTGLTQYRPHTEGSIQTKSGTYMAYGQVLTIERGLLNFSGTLDNPGVNIRAMRNSTPVNAGVEITGSAQNPVTKLVSDPSVTDSEKLAWLVLGHGMEQTTKNDYGALSLAAGIILSQGQSVPLQTQLAKAAGLDELSFSGGDATSASVVFGKRLTSQLYLSYAKSISGLLDVARLTFNITPQWSIRGEAGTESAVDMLYTFSFK